MNKATHGDSSFELLAALLGFAIAAIGALFLYGQILERMPYEGRSIVESGPPVPDAPAVSRDREKPETITDTGPSAEEKRQVQQISPPATNEQVPALDKPTILNNEHVGDPAPTNKVESEHIADLRSRKLLLPVQDVKPEDLRDSFSEARGSSRTHEAIDILAPRNTPVLAVEDGKIARLWHSQFGGITIYQFDPDEEYAYYYAHLERYADNLKEGDEVKKGQVIGYVGTSGNAPPNTPHLHFTIFKLTEEKQWWEGTAVNPYLVYR